MSSYAGIEYSFACSGHRRLQLIRQASGCLIIYIYKPFIFLQMLLPIFSAAIVGGVGNPIGAVVGGYVIALSELFVTFAYRKVLAYLLPESMEPSGMMQFLSTDYKFAVSFIILVIVLIVRPTGIFRGKTI